MANAVLVESSPRVVTMRGEEMLQQDEVAAMVRLWAH